MSHIAMAHCLFPFSVLPCKQQTLYRHERCAPGSVSEPDALTDATGAAAAENAAAAAPAPLTDEQQLSAIALAALNNNSTDAETSSDNSLVASSRRSASAVSAVAASTVDVPSMLYALGLEGAAEAATVLLPGERAPWPSLARSPAAESARGAAVAAAAAATRAYLQARADAVATAEAAAALYATAVAKAEAAASGASAVALKQGATADAAAAAGAAASAAIMTEADAAAAAPARVAAPPVNVVEAHWRALSLCHHINASNASDARDLNAMTDSATSPSSSANAVTSCSSLLPMYDSHLLTLIRGLTSTGDANLTSASAVRAGGLPSAGFDQPALRAVLTGAPVITHSVMAYLAALWASPSPACEVGFVALHTLIARRPAARAPALLLVLAQCLSRQHDQAQRALALLRDVLALRAVRPRALAFVAARLAALADPLFPRGCGALPRPSRAVAGELRSRVASLRRQQGGQTGVLGVSLASTAGDAASGTVLLNDGSSSSGSSSSGGSRSVADIVAALDLTTSSVHASAPDAEAKDGDEPEDEEDKADAALLAAGDLGAQLRLARRAEAFLDSVDALRRARESEAARVLRLGFAAARAAPAAVALLLRAYAVTPHQWVRDAIHTMLRVEPVAASADLLLALEQSPPAAQPAVLQLLDQLTQVSAQDIAAAEAANAAAATPEAGLQAQTAALAKAREAVLATLQSAPFQRTARALLARSGGTEVRYLLPLLPTFSKQELAEQLPALLALAGRVWELALARVLDTITPPRVSALEVTELLAALPVAAAAPALVADKLRTLVVSSGRVAVTGLPAVLLAMARAQPAPPALFLLTNLALNAPDNNAARAAADASAAAAAAGGASALPNATSLSLSAANGGVTAGLALSVVSQALSRRGALAEACQVQYLSDLLLALVKSPSTSSAADTPAGAAAAAATAAAAVDVMLRMNKAQLAAVARVHASVRLLSCHISRSLSFTCDFIIILSLIVLYEPTNLLFSMSFYR